MMKININNVEKVQAAIDAAQAKARVRTISVEDVAEMCEAVEKRLNISKAAMKGVTFSADYNARAFPNAYKGIPESTIISAVYSGSAWYITSICREKTRRPSAGYRVQLTDKAQAAIMARVTAF